MGWAVKRGTSTPYLLDLPIIRHLPDFSNYLRLSPGLLYRLSARPDLFYRRFELEKRSGEKRVVYGPSRELKVVQAWIAKNILYKVQIHDAATAYRQGRNIRSNVEPHARKKYLLCLDVEDFFGSIERYKVYTVFSALGYNAHVSNLFTELCTLEGRLPQGAVTSPILSNIVCIRLDRRIAGYAGRRHIVYTRYADDITLSGDDPETLYKSHPIVGRILADEGFLVNHSKTRRLGPRKRRIVTGLVISKGGSVGIGTRRKRQLRAAIHNLYTKFMPANERAQLENHIQGWLGHLMSVDKDAYAYLHDYKQRLLARGGEALTYSGQDGTAPSMTSPPG